MKPAIVAFNSVNSHWGAGILHPSYRHVWCMVLDERANVWVSHNFGANGHEIVVESAADFDIVGYARDCGNEVYVIERQPPLVLWPVMLNNCVALTKAVCGIRSWAITPYQLRKDVRRLAVQEDAAWRSFALT